MRSVMGENAMGLPLVSQDTIMIIEGPLTKITNGLQDPVQAYLNLGKDLVHLNALIGKTIKVKSTGFSTCKACKRQRDEPLFRMGFCKPCFFESPMAGDFILHPEKSMAHTGKVDRDLKIESDIQLQPHTVYMADSGQVKVGVTAGNKPWNRWMDQGASAGKILAITDNRYEAGMIEVALKAHYSDKTHWRKMLQGNRSEQSLHEVTEGAKKHVPDELIHFIQADGHESQIKYDMPEQLPKLNWIKLNGTVTLEDELIGLRGQYLVFKSGLAWNVRGQEGLEVEMSW
ncbi:MAG: DUF2797 domain-containing protein [Flavobacteriales bacterium]|nr:DUF2797 domain-containing protein [Flavobacteriales bacterium]